MHDLLCLANLEPQVLEYISEKLELRDRFRAVTILHI